METIKETEQFNIRKGLNEDIERIYLFEREYIIEHESDQLCKWDGAKEKTINRLIDNLGRLFVATIGRELVGHAYWNIDFKEPCICSIFMIKNYRSLGIATNLMKAIEDQISRQEYSKINLSTLENNPAQHLFNKLDYKVVEIKDGWLYYTKTLNHK